MRLSTILLPALLITAPAMAGPRAPPLSVEAARIIIAGVVINAGKVFAVERNRYAIDRVDVSARGTVYTLRLVIRPLGRAP